MNPIKWFMETRRYERVAYAFTDVVNGRPVFYYRDRHGVHWLKHSKWGIFKVADPRKETV